MDRRGESERMPAPGKANRVRLTGLDAPGANVCPSAATLEGSDRMQCEKDRITKVGMLRGSSQVQIRDETSEVDRYLTYLTPKYSKCQRYGKVRYQYGS